MRIIKYFFLVCCLFSVSLFAQTKVNANVADESSYSNQIHPVDPAPLLEQYYKRNGIDPNKEAPLALRKTSAWNFKVGDTKSFKLADLSPGGATYSSAFTCRAVGNYCYVFVEDSLWVDQHNRVDQNVVDSIRITFDSKTPAPASKGIYLTDTAIFGNPPDVDNDPKIIILVHNIRDGYSGYPNPFVAGFFSSADETGSIGNSPAEIYHLDANPLNLKKPTGNASLQTGLSTTAHEFQHMIHWNYIKNATTFINEGFSLAAEVINGYPIDNQSGYVNETNRSLTTWRSFSDANVTNDYSRAARFFLYVYEQFGATFFTKYLNQRSDGISAFNSILISMGTTRRFQSVVADWFMANMVNNKNVKPEWGYTYPNLLYPVARIHTNPNLTYDDNLAGFGVQYITFNSGKNLSIKFNDKQNYSITVKAIKYGTGNPVVDNVVPGADYSVPDFGTTYSKVTFAVYFTADLLSLTATIPYSYTVTGTATATAQVIAYDTTEPSGVYPQSIGDTVAVRFDGISGAKLDSIKVALRNTVPIEGGVWRSGSSSFNGKKISTAFNPAGKLTPPSPYPVPWPNWARVDLKSQNIDASTNFNVCFIIDGNYSGASSPTNRVMITSVPGSSSYHSYYYLNNPGSTLEPGWYYPGNSSAGTISLFLIRAYVTFGTTGIEGPVEILPSSFALGQNYPNPFNPNTIISYNLPKQSSVQIKIYDAVGNEVRSLISEDKAAGKYNILWDARDNFGNQVASGVYFYRITAGDFVQTKKMILMK